MTLIVLIALAAWASGYASGRWHALRIARDTAYTALLKHIELELANVGPGRHKVVVNGPRRALRLVK